MKSFLIFLILPYSLYSEQVAKGIKPSCDAIILINVPFTSEDWFKRPIRQADVGPFWANRGRRDPKYGYNKLYAEQPHWLFIRKDSENFGNFFDPFFTTRGKKGTVSLMKVLLKEFRRSKTLKGYTSQI